LVSSHGSEDESTAPRPMSRLCIAKPTCRWLRRQQVGDEGAEGLHADVDGGVEHPEHPAAIQSALELGIAMSARLAQIAPARK
jgi:hypothetical protein